MKASGHIFIVEDKVILELKSVEHTANTRKKKVFAYLRLTGIKLGMIVNIVVRFFNKPPVQYHHFIKPVNMI